MPLSTLWWALGACATPTDTAEPEVVVDEGTMAWELDVEAVEFGEVAYGSTSAASLTVTNTGDTDWTVFGLQSGDTSVAAPLPAVRQVAPGAASVIELSWTPEGVAALDAELQILLSGVGGLQTVTLDESGVVWGPAAELVVAAEVLDDVDLGCSTSTIATLRNTGNADLTVTGFSFDGSAGFTLTLPTPLPWTLEPGHTQTAGITFAPTIDGTVIAALDVTSDDPASPVTRVSVTGNGTPRATITDEWVVPASENITALIAVNEVVNTQFRDQWEPGLEVLFEELLASGIPFRVAVVCPTSGVVEGDNPWIDETWDVDDAVEAAMAMVPCSGIDNDYLLQTLETAIGVNREWLLDESIDWEESKLNLVGINSDQEQSTGNATLFVNDYLTYKADSADIAVHGMGGDTPSGCPGAEPFTPFSDAAGLTDGVFLSICDADWTSNMHSLAQAFMGEGQVSFLLSDTPAEWSIEVWLDGTRTTSGWSFDDASNRITFDDDAYPEEGAELRIEYLADVECPA